MHRILSSETKYILISSLLICICFIFFTCFIALANIVRTIPRRSEKNGLVLVLILAQMFWVSSLFRMTLTVGFLSIVLIMLKHLSTLLSPRLLSWIDVVFSQRSFINQIGWSSFYPSVHVCGRLWFLIYRCWPFIPYLEWNRLEHNVKSVCVIEFSLQVFYS